MKATEQFFFSVVLLNYSVQGGSNFGDWMKY